MLIYKIKYLSGDVTYIDTDSDEREVSSISKKLIRLSVGVEHPDDLICDIGQSLYHVPHQIPKPIYIN